MSAPARISAEGIAKEEVKRGSQPRLGALNSVLQDTPDGDVAGSLGLDIDLTITE